MNTCSHCGQQFSDALRFCPSDGTPLRVSKPHRTLEGTVLAGRYQIGRELGHGGMSVVYLATHLKMDRLVALKLLRAESLVDEDAVSRFHREARSASQISHPNVVAVYDFGETEDGLTYLAMEYVEGRSLDALLKEAGALSPRQAGRIVWQIANGLAAAHDLRIVHRDLKPSNLMVTRYRQWDDFIKIVDFGIAKAFGATTASEVTTAGMAIGTPEYMSPEQWAAADIDHRSDIYSLALIAIRMLAGALPPRRSMLSVYRDDVLDAIPTTADWPEALKAVLRRALAPLPEERYSSAPEFAVALAEAVDAWAPPVPGVREPWERHLSRRGVRRLEESTMPARARQAAVGLVAAAALSLAVWGVYHVAAGRADPLEAGDQVDTVAQAPVSPPTGDPLDPNIDADPPRPNRSPRRTPAERSIGSDTAAAATATVATPPPSVPISNGSASQLTSPRSDSLTFVLRGIDLDHPDSANAERLIRIAGGLLQEPQADSTRIEISYRSAEALLFLGDTARGCATLRRLRDDADAMGFRSRHLAQLLRARCE